MELPDDVYRWVVLHFREPDREEALRQLRSAVIHDGQLAEPRLLRCACFSSGGNLRRLAECICELGKDWRDVILGAEYTPYMGNAVRVRDFNNAMNAKPNVVPIPIPGQKYISLTTLRKSGTGVATPVWFGEEDDKLYVMTRSDMGKTKRIRNNPQVQVAPCTMRGKVTGPEFPAKARILPPEEHGKARATINRKYWMARIPLIWARTDTYIELSFG